MSKIEVILIIILLLLQCSEKDKYTAFSLNINKRNFDKQKEYWPRYKSALINKIKNNKFDIVGMQGVPREELQNFNQQLTNYSMIVENKIVSRRRGNIPIIYNPVKIRNLVQGIFWLSNTPNLSASKSWNAGHPAPVVWAKFETIPSNKRFYIFNTNLDPYSKKAREQSIYLLLKKITNITGGDPFLVMGDFHFMAKNELFQTFTQEWQNIAEISVPEKDLDNKSSTPISGIRGSQKTNHIFVASNIKSKKIGKFNSSLQISDNKHSSLITNIKIPRSNYKLRNSGTKLQTPVYPPYISKSDSVDFIFTDQTEVQLDSYNNVDIRYTLNNSTPDQDGRLYEIPIEIKETSKLKARSYRGKRSSRDILERKFYKVNSAIPLKLDQLMLNNPVIPEYFARGKKSLIDHKRGKLYHPNQDWLGFRSDFDIIIAFDEIVECNKLMLGFLKDKPIGGCLPEEINVFHSKKSVKYNKYASNQINDTLNRTARYDYTLDLKSLKTRYLRIVADKNTSSSKSKYIFIDEIIVW